MAATNSTARPLLSQPAAMPSGLLNRIPQTSVSSRGSANSKLWRIQVCSQAIWPNDTPNWMAALCMNSGLHRNNSGRTSEV